MNNGAVCGYVQLLVRHFIMDRFDIKIRVYERAVYDHEKAAENVVREIQKHTSVPISYTECVGDGLLIKREDNDDDMEVFEVSALIDLVREHGHICSDTFNELVAI